MKEYTYAWNPNGEDDEPILKITKSSFGTYNWCPKKYEFQYYMRLPTHTTEPMIKGTAVHNARDDFFEDFDVKKAEELSQNELVTYNMGLHPIDDYGEIYLTMAEYEAARFKAAQANNSLDNYLPVINEKMLDAEITIPQNCNPKYPLRKDYQVHLQGIIDRMFLQDGTYLPMELKTGIWKDSRNTSMRKELAFYKILFENAPDERLEELNLDRNIPIKFWGWYYPVSSYMYIEPAKKASVTSVMKGIAKMIHTYERHNFEAKYFWKTCADCSFYNICEVAQDASWT
jgi:hypothetical protein